MKNAVFRDKAPHGSYCNRRFGAIIRLHLKGENIRELGATLVINSRRNMEATRSSEKSVLTRMVSSGLLRRVALVRTDVFLRSLRRC
jgi:hypothetical protein